ncbi:DUF4328 domain-containing protein [Spirilliplanes yamanashiensis]|uniref:DUF4328 domain-containing protein n=1 Tax=Spirilliplanes yamanashiensis TaxID=42233 RepID=A0A8J3YAR1_9ACTN|nr:DUF4328 domain-containing protein [Spirilliplanes yamanashiensis]MDP9816070.1 hypothetical protein [Spirilliplanes yamanashiensis]GIJ04330.1 hypothetical protein Sya03_36820 [Spirilliplanes yamanashiensis]
MFCRSCGSTLPVGAWACPRCAAPVSYTPARAAYPVRTLGTVVAAALAVAVALQAVSFAGTLAVWIAASSGAGPGTLDTFLFAEGLAALPVLVVMLVTGVLVIVWTYRVVTNAEHQYRYADTPIGGGWAIAGWLVPIANLFVPYRAVAGAARTTFQSATTPALLKWWWAAWLLAQPVESVAAAAAGEPTAHAYRGAVLGAAVALGLYAAAGACLAVMVRRISAAQDAHTAGAVPLLTPGTTVPPPPPPGATIGA